MTAPAVITPADFDHRWLDRLTAKQRSVYDCHVLGDAVPLLKATSYFDASVNGYGHKPGDVQLVMALHASPAYIAFNDAAWAKYGFAERTRSTDPKTNAPAQRNLFASEAEGDPYAAVAVPVLQRRGAIVLFCNNVMRNLSASLARRRNETTEAVRADLIASFLPGVVLVPAVVAATAMAQERGCAYTLVNG